MKYDYLIVGAGLFGAVFAHEVNKRGKKCIVVEKRPHIGGNIFTKEIEGIHVHQYGAHIFHCNEKKIWDYVQNFAEFNRFTNAPIAIYKDELYNLPFNMNTFSKMWGIKTPEEARAVIDLQVREAGIVEPKNLEEQAISMVGKDLYTKLIRGYTEKQWGRKATELPDFIIKRIPLRFTFDNNYFNDKYQGIPVGGYTQIIEKLLDKIDIKLNTDYFIHKDELSNIAEKTIFTGMIDEYYDYCFGELEYRSLKFETEILNCSDYQGNAVVNYTEYEIPYTRVIEHKHFDLVNQTNLIEKTVVTREYPANWKRGDEPYYPVNDDKNNALFTKYKELADKEENVIFGGRLGMYKYFDMHNVIAEALNLAHKIL